MWAFYQAIVVNKELSQKEKLWIYQLIYNYHLWSWGLVSDQKNESSFLFRVAGFSHRDRIRSLNPQEFSADLLPLYFKGASWDGWGIWLGYLLGSSLWRFSGLVQLGGDPRVDSELAGPIHISSGLETPQSPPRGAGKRCWGERHLEYPL